MRKLLLATLAVALGGCGGGEDPRLTVAAASSLKAPLTDYAASFDGADVRLSFAGSDQLAAQIRAGARPDVFASADDELPAALHRQGLVERPVRFARNRLVVAVRDEGRVKRVGDLAESGVTISAGAPSVPVGAYARRAISELPLPLARGIEDNVVSEEPDVAAVIGRVRSGAADAGFAYATDVEAADGLGAIELPVEVEAVYAAAVVPGRNAAEARRFVEGLVKGEGRRALEEAGFR